ncbi:MAG: diguanylate cyclase domain-containing protein [Cuspidothrix sp.]
MSHQIDELLNTAPCGFLSFTDDGTIIMINATLLALLGYESDELWGHKIEIILPMASRIFYQTHFFPLLKMHDKAEEIYFSLRSKQRRNIPILANAVRLENSGNFVNNCIFIPIYQRIQYEDEILKAKKEAQTAIQAQKEAELALRQQYEKTLLLKQISEKIRQSLNSQETFEIAAHKIGQLFQVDRCLIHSYSDILIPELPLVAEYLSSPGITSLMPLKIPIIGNSHAEKIIANDQVLVSPDVFADPLLQTVVPFCHQIGLKSMLAVRTSYQGKPNGVIALHQCDRLRDWQDWEIDLLQQLSYQLSIAIQQSNLYSQLQLELKERQRAEQIIRQQADREILLRKITQQIHQSLNLSDIFEIASGGIRQCLHADRVSIFQFHPDSNFCIGEFISETVAPGFESAKSPIIQDHCFAEKYAPYYQQGRIHTIEDTYQADLLDCYRNILVQFKIRANLVVPLLNGQDLWGLLCVHQCSAPRYWQEFEIDFVQQIANQLAIAINQTDLFEKLQKELAERKLAEAKLTQSNEELANATHLLEKLVNIDGLTQIANRRCFNNRLEQEWQRLYREQQPLSLLLFDVDYFKRYNDTYGHQLGDECLIKLAQTLQKVVSRSADLIARYGGEEFVVILPNTNTKGAMVIAQKIHSAIQYLAIPHRASEVSNTVTISLGITTELPNSELSPTGLIQQADKALYRAKQLGRNQSVVF